MTDYIINSRKVLIKALVIDNSHNNMLLEAGSNTNIKIKIILDSMKYLIRKSIDMP